MTDLLDDDIYKIPVLKSFDDLIIEFDIPYRDRRKYNSLVDNIVQRGLLDGFVRGFDTFDIFSNNIFLAPNVPRYSYSILSKNVTSPPQKKVLWFLGRPFGWPLST